ncbi:MAG: T9SS type A sorting domain-containing protein, partial [Candidatus Marinimicrobia bacterium]|nr:T9SS type A sorting domain-containing protein [Candidatus Neomarinimicrobiota bacterium]
HDVTVQNCYVTRTNANDGIVIHSGPAGTIAGSNFIIRNNISEHSAEQGYDITTGTNVLMEGNISRLNKQGGITFGHTASGLIVRRHFSENEPTANTSASVKISSPDFTLENSLFIGSASYNKPIISIGPGSDSQPENVKLYNNTFIWNSSSEGNIFFLAQHFTGIQCTIKNLEMKNNIFYSRTSSRGIFSFQQADRPPDFGSGFKFDNNLFFMPGGIEWSVGGNSNSPFSFPEYKTTFNQDLNSIETDPLFVDPGGSDFHLLSTSSPAYNAGATLELTQYLDLDSISIPQAGKSDIGAFEFSISTYGLNANPEGSNMIRLTWSDNFSDETGFTIRRKKENSGIYSEIATIGTDVTTYDDGELDVNVTYYYQVKAVHPDNIYDWSNEVFASTSIGTNISPDFHETTGLIVFPNPADSFITLRTGVKAGEGKITIFNMVGEPVYSENCDRESKTIGLDRLSAGLFVIQLDTPSNQQCVKFIKR